MKKKLKRINKVYFYIVLTILLVVGMFFLVRAYIKYLDSASKKVITGTDLEFVLKSPIESDNSFYRANISEDLSEYLNNKNINNAKKVLYSIDNAHFQIEFEFDKKDDNYNFSITKIVDKSFNINARMNYKCVKYIEYKYSEDATVLNIVTDLDSDYYAMSANGEYFLGDDIDEIIYKNDRFYYITYNKKYISLKGAKKCSGVLGKIDDYSYSDVYYKTGKLNFMKEYYQKIYEASISVDKYCKSLK